MEKNVLYKNCRVQRGTPDGNLDSDPGVQYRGYNYFEEKICNLQLTITYFFLKTTVCFLYTN